MRRAWVGARPGLCAFERRANLETRRKSILSTGAKGTGTAKKAASASFPKGVSQPAIRALASAGYTDIDQLAGVSEKHLATLHGMGPKALRIIGETLKEQGKALKP